MKCKIVYVGKEVDTIIENSDYNFVDFCAKQLFKARIYISEVSEGNGISIAINTDNILFVEEIKE